MWELGLASAPQEVVAVIAHTSEGAMRTVFEVGRGSSLGVDVHIPTLIAGVCASGTDVFTLAHNHPNGNVGPSVRDMEFTSKLSETVSLAGLWMMDHLILGPKKNQVFSMVANRLYLPAQYGDDGNANATIHYQPTISLVTDEPA